MKILKRVLLALAALLALVVLLVVVKFFVLSPKVRPAADMKAPTSPEAIERGRYLAHHVAGCLGCHSEVDESKSGEPIVEGRLGSGRDFGVFPGAPFRMRAHNLTPDKDTGIGAFSDGQLVRAMREGIGLDGHVLFPFMPFRTYAVTLSDADALAIVAYLRTLPPIKNDPGKSTVDFPVSMFVRGLPAPLESSPPGPPPASDVLARGNWVLKVASCHDCHDGFNARREAIPGRELSGGAEFPIPGRGTTYAANITSDAATGIGSYSDEDLLRVINEGVGKSGRTLYGMPWRYYAGMTAEDKSALIAALRKVPPVANVVPAPALK